MNMLPYPIKRFNNEVEAQLSHFYNKQSPNINIDR